VACSCCWHGSNPSTRARPASSPQDVPVSSTSRLERRPPERRRSPTSSTARAQARDYPVSGPDRGAGRALRGTWVAQGASPGKLRPAWLRKPPARGADGRHDTPASRGGEQGNAESAQSPEHRGPPRGGGPMTHIDDVADDIIDLALTAHLRVPHVPKVRAPRPGFPHLASRGVSTWGSGEVSPSERGGTSLRRLQG
jgi:hypothetical protein